MSSIGPQMPSSQPSAKRKRTPEQEPTTAASAAPSSPSKQARRDAPPASRNTDEIDLSDSDSDDGYGPRAPGAIPASNRASNTASAPSARTPGPTLPPTRNTDEINLSSDSDSGPAPLPQMQPKATTQPQPQPAPDSDSDSEDDYGPALPGSAAASARRGPIGPSLPPSEEAPTRDEWMLAPPSSSGYTERDPTKLRARKFASKTSSTAGEGVSAIWTETPEEKLRRLQDSVLGRGGDESGAAAGGTASAKSTAEAQQEEERNRKIAAAIEGQRGKSLYDQHNDQKRRAAGGKDEDEEDDPSKRAFDREKDMALSSKIGTAQRRELVNKSANFGGRFQKGSYL